MGNQVTRGLTTADPLVRNGVRVKKIGNLASIEKGYNGARANILSKTMIDNIVPRNLYTQGAPTPKAEALQAVNEMQLEQLQ